MFSWAVHGFSCSILRHPREPTTGTDKRLDEITIPNCPGKEEEIHWRKNLIVVEIAQGEINPKFQGHLGY